MNVRVLFVARCVVVLALFPALAGCATQDEPLQRADLPPEPDAPARAWLPRDEAVVRPGSLLRTEQGDCPVNFVFQREDNGALFLGTTAYCVRDLPVGSLAVIGEEHLAILVYSSFQTMAEVGERDPDALEYNDFAVFHLDRSSAHLVSPALPGGGPAALAEGGRYQLGDRLRLHTPTPRVPVAEWRDSVVSGVAGRWALLTYSALPGAPGELGGGVVDPEGRAVGVAVTLGVLPNPGANGVARLDTLMTYARDHAKLDMVLVTSPQAS